MSDPLLIQEILDATTLPVMAKARIGHTGEAAVLEALDVDCIDESEVLSPADEVHHINKSKFKIPFVCGAKDLGEALRRIGEGAAMIRLKGNAGTGNVLQAVRHARSVFAEIKQLQNLSEDEVYVFAKEHMAPLHLVQQTRTLGRLPVVTFAAGGVATPADVSLLMQMGCDGVFVGSGIFKGENSPQRARAMVLACTYWQDPRVVAKVSSGLGKAMVGILDDGETYNHVADSKL
jgi:pyridoxal 5'-phosphate synthase pdxS subunit